METELIKRIIEDNLEQTTVYISGDGQHFSAQVISPLFEDQSLLARSRMVYSVLNDYIDSGELHAISMKTLTPKEWEKTQNG